MNRWILGAILVLAGGCHLVFPFDLQVELEADTAASTTDLSLAGMDLHTDTVTEQQLDLPTHLDLRKSDLSQLPDALVVDSAKVKDQAIAIDAGASSDTGHPCSKTSSWQADYNTTLACTYLCSGVILQCTQASNTCSCSNKQWSKGNCSDPGGAYQFGTPCIGALDNGCCKPP